MHFKMAVRIAFLLREESASAIRGMSRTETEFVIAPGNRMQVIAMPVKTP